MQCAVRTMSPRGKSVEEKLFYIALEFEQKMAITAMSITLENSFEVHYGQVIIIEKKRFEFPAALSQSRAFKVRFTADSADSVRSPGWLAYIFTDSSTINNTTVYIGPTVDCR